MSTTKIIFEIESDIQISLHLYNEAAELFLNHLKKYYEEQLLKGNNFPYPFGLLPKTKNVQMIIPRQLNHLSKSCPLYYKRQKGLGSAARPSQNQLLSIQ